MRYPVDNYKTEWDNHAEYDLPLLKVGIFSIIRLIKNLHMAIKTNSPKIGGIGNGLHEGVNI